MQFKIYQQTVVLFIRYEDKQKVLRQFKTKHGECPIDALGSTISARVFPDSLLYTWGCCKNGKLGISNNYYQDLYESENHMQFFKSDKPVRVERAEMLRQVNPDDPAVSKEQIENKVEFDSKYLFTPCPQPVVSLLGIQCSKVVCGQEHVLLMTNNKELYSWGSNEHSQLGIDKQKTSKVLEFSSLVYESITDEPVDTKGSEGGSNQDDGTASNEESFKVEKKQIVTTQKKVQVNYQGVPVRISSIKGKIENIQCGDLNSFAIVKL
jgi:hypothetical protein